MRAPNQVRLEKKSPSFTGFQPFIWCGGLASAGNTGDEGEVCSCCSYWKTDGGENNLVSLFLDEEKVQTGAGGNLGPGGSFLAVKFVKAAVLQSNAL